MLFVLLTCKSETLTVKSTGHLEDKLSRPNFLDQEYEEVARFDKHFPLLAPDCPDTQMSS